MKDGKLYPWPWKTALILCAVSLLLLGRQLSFSGWVHADEPNKVMQITHDKYNFNHPLLMLHSVKLYSKLTGISGDYDRVIVAGRWSSVIFSSLAVAFLVLVIGRLHGPFCGFSAGLFVLCTPLFYELAHYFKEDPCLLFGLSLSLLTMQTYTEKPSFQRAAALGAACGIAISGKYAGLVILPFAVWTIISSRRMTDLLTVASFALVVFGLINLPMISSPEIWKSRVDLEVSRLKATGVPNPRQLPHGVYFAVFAKYSTPIIVLLIGAYLYSLWQRRFRLSPAEGTILILPIAYLLVLSFIPTKSDRYFLPGIVLFACVAALGLRSLLGLKHGKLLAGLLVIASVGLQAPKVYAEEIAFSSRRHNEVLQFLTTNLPPSACILVDNYNCLPPTEDYRPFIKQRTLEPQETLASLGADGFTHVLVTQKRYSMFAPGSRRASGLSPEEDQKMRALYNQLVNRGKLIFHWKEGRKSRLEPDFQLYELPNWRNRSGDDCGLTP